MAKRKIPTNMQPWTANINGEEYEYESGTTAEVPNEVAALIDFIDASMPKEDPKAAQRAIEGEVTQIVKDSFDGGVGYEETAEGVILPETSFEVSVSASQVVLSESFPYTFEIGKYYTVTFDGVTETYTAVDINGHIGITSSEKVFNGNGWACAVLESNLVFVSIDESFYGAHAISISKGANIVHKIDSKFIPASAKALFANSAGNLFTDFTSFSEQDKPPSEPLTYDEAYSLYNSCIPVFIFGGRGNTRYTVAGIRGGTWDSNAREYKYIYFDVMDGDSTTVKSFSVENPNYSGES